MKYQQYINDVLEGRIIVGAKMKMAVERFVATLRQPDVEFDAKAYHRCIDFFGLLRHFKGKSAGNRFELEPWQCFIIADLIALKRNGLRLRKKLYLEVARKNGKTAFLAALMLYIAFASGEAGAESDFAANSREQAGIAYEFAQTFAQQLDRRGRRLKVQRRGIWDTKTKSKMLVFASDATKLDGFDASAYLLDEYHAANDRRLYDVLDSSQGSRLEPIGAVVTTAGFNKLGPCYKLRENCIEILNGAKIDDSYSIFIFDLDDEDDWRDPAVWCKANPNMGITVMSDYIADKVNDAVNQPTAEVNVRTKVLNQWCDAAEVWLPDQKVLDVTREINADDLRGLDCYIGVDLNSTSDLGSICIMWIDGDKKFFKWKYYLPEESLSEPRFREQYGQWRREGALTITPGNVTDYDYILNDIRDIDKEHVLRYVAYDAWNATQFVVNATAAGLPMKPFSQTLGNFNRPTKEFERLMLLGTNIVLDNNPISRYCIKNVVMARDNNGNCKPSKKFAEKKIDGVITALEALGISFDDNFGSVI